jgi:hypothetical protein
VLSYNNAVLITIVKSFVVMVPKPLECHDAQIGLNLMFVTVCDFSLNPIFVSGSLKYCSINYNFKKFCSAGSKAFGMTLIHK